METPIWEGYRSPLPEENDDDDLDYGSFTGTNPYMDTDATPVTRSQSAPADLASLTDVNEIQDSPAITSTPITQDELSEEIDSQPFALPARRPPTKQQPKFTIRILTPMTFVQLAQSPAPTPSPEGTPFDPMSPYNSSSFIMRSNMPGGLGGDLAEEYGTMDCVPCESMYGEWMESPACTARPAPSDLVDDHDEFDLAASGNDQTVSTELAPFEPQSAVT